MKKNFYILILAMLSVVTATASEQSELNLMSRILRGDFKARTLSQEVMDSVLNSGARTETVEDWDPAFVRLSRYTIEVENEHTLFRHSYEADHYVKDTKKGTRVHLGKALTRDVQMSADGKYVAFAEKNKLYIYKVDFGTTVSVSPRTNAYDEPLDDDEIFEGVSDWLYEEEFGITCLYAFSPDSKQLAFIRLDETQVPTFSWQEYLGEGEGLYTNSYPRLESLRYPKAGAKNAKAELCVYDMATKDVRVMKLPEMEDAYLPRIAWTNPQGEGKTAKEAELVVLRMNRDQNKMEVYYCNPKSMVATLWYKEESRDCYVDYSLFDEWQWLSDNKVLVVSEKSGWRQAYLYSAQGQELKQLTRDGKDVTAVYGLDEKTQTLYYQQADAPETRDCYALSVKKGVATRLTNGDGWYTMTLADDYSAYIECFENVSTPNRYTLYGLKGQQACKRKVLEDNADVRDQFRDVCEVQKEFFTFVTERGDVLHGWMIDALHDGLARNGKAPVVMTQYSGPGSQRVVNRWKKTWDYALAEMGYIVVCVDGRGTDARGRKWRNETYMNLGEKEAEDQLSVARHISTWSKVDGERIAMVGWSYGGFQVLTTMCHKANMNESGQPLIKAGIAIAPVTDWRLYDSAYTERYMRRPQVNEEGYRQSSLLGKAGELKGRLLLVHGLADDNVHAQQSLLLSDALVAAGIQFDEQVYVDDNHFLRKRSNYEHLHLRLLRFLRMQL